jgi:two-component system, chemotaxis family, protein-glutamate methylesterase/glutaminase
MTGPFRVLLISDSMQLVRRAAPLFATRSLVRVGSMTAVSWMLDAVLQERPDVVVVDVASGEPAFAAIEAVMAERPTPILALHGTGSQDEPFRALALGALDVAELPVQTDDAFWLAMAHKLALLAQVRVVQHVRGKKRRRGQSAARPDEPPFPLVAIAASLGGPRALAQLLAMLPRKLPAPVAICQHISEGFTVGLATWLSAETGHVVTEAKDGDALEPGRVYLAPSRYHFRVVLPGRICLDGGPPIQGFRPSCDALLESAARAFGRRTVGVILTGMGRDGAVGLRAIRDGGGRTVAQDEGSCVVYGMPREAVALGAAEAVLPLEKIAATLVRWVDEC